MLGVGIKKQTRLALFAGLLMTIQPTYARTGNVYFSGLIGPRNFCFINIQHDGDITANAASNILSTSNPGGRPAKVSIETTNGSFKSAFDISASNPVSFNSAPAGGNTGVTFQVNYSGSGATTFGPLPASQPVKMSKGTTEIEIDLMASRTDVFPEGDYAATVVILCE